MKMHDGEVDVDAALVARLVASQFPDLSDLPIAAVRSTGTVNAIDRIGEQRYARLPRTQEWVADLDKERQWLPRVAPRVSLEVPAALAAWERALEAHAWSGAAPVWIHADLLRPNLLVRNGRLCAVLDFGAAGAGDPATDVIAAWSVFGPAGQNAFRSALDVDDGTWNRARGIALHQAALIIPYYAETNPGFVALAKRTVEGISSASP